MTGDNDDSCACVVLAAGASRRLGRPKQLLKKDGETLLHRTVRLTMEAGFAPVVVVVGAHSDRMRKELQGLAAEVIENSSWESGMASSVHEAVAFLQRQSRPCRHLLVTVCDQPMLDAGVLERIKHASCMDPGKVVAAAYAGVPGVPAVFPSSFFPHLLELEGDKGARNLLRSLGDEIVLVPFAGGKQDIDTEDDVCAAGLV